MSMNLYIKVNGNTLDLLQTPTAITNMILVNSKGKIVEYRDYDALRPIQAYIKYVEGTLNGVYFDEDDFADQVKFVEDHVKYIKKSIKGFNTLSVYAM